MHDAPSTKHDAPRTTHQAPSTKHDAQSPPASRERYDICVLGLGYIGLPTSSIFATKGKKVLGVDVVPRVVETINDGRIHIDEPDLDLLVRAAVQSGNLRAAEKPEPADTFIIAVPTPFVKGADGSKKPDLSYVEAASRSLAPVVKEGDLIILESTSPVGTTEKVREWLLDELSTQNNAPSTTDQAPSTKHQAPSTKTPTLLFAHCPERILPGQMLKELVTNDRICGGLSPEAAEAAKRLYQTFCTADIFLTDARTAEMAKLTENAFRDVNIAFANELSMICEALKIDVWELIRLANRHPRVNILQPGPGVGGHCIAVDPWFIVDAAPERARIIRTAREVNDAKPDWVVEKVRAKAARFREPVIACFGLAFKAGVDDLRESPALNITEALCVCESNRVLVVEPHIDELPESLAGRVELTTADNAIKHADIVVLLVDHRQFREIPSSWFRSKVLIDTKGIFH